MTLGARIRQQRANKRMTGAELARRAGVSRGLISQVESGRAKPSLETLHRVAGALEIPVALLFEGHPGGSGRVVRRDERKQLHLPQSNIAWGLLTPDLQGSLEVLWIELEPNQKRFTPQHAHPGEEVDVVVTGKLHFAILDEEYVLNAGDALTFDCSQPHSFANFGSEKVIFISTITPPTF